MVYNRAMTSVKKIGSKAAALLLLVSSVSVSGLTGCLPAQTEPSPGPDKQSIGTWYGGAMGAGSGAVLGHNLIAAAGPGAWVGLGLGAVFGMMSGLGQDLLEEDMIRRRELEQALREKAWVQEVLAEHYQRRLELHPNRDIFPADLFFDADKTELTAHSQVLVSEIARLSLNRMPWSRIMISSYAMSRDPKSPFAEYLTERRAKAIALQLVRCGIDPRRVVTQAVTTSEPILVDPYDSPGRYNQAIEIVPLDY
jgi:outer membrane protein OmpA-like peptidoglycan-associated protein